MATIWQQRSAQAASNRAPQPVRAQNPAMQRPAAPNPAMQRSTRPQNPAMQRPAAPNPAMQRTYALGSWAANGYGAPQQQPVRNPQYAPFGVSRWF